MASKIWIKDTIDGYFDPSMKIEDLIAQLSKLKEDYPSHKDFEIDREYGDPEDGAYFTIKGYRLETDKEFDKRLKLLQKEKEKKTKERADSDIAERELYEDLKKKFEK